MVVVFSVCFEANLPFFSLISDFILVLCLFFCSIMMCLAVNSFLFYLRYTWLPSESWYFPLVLGIAQSIALQIVSFLHSPYFSGILIKHVFILLTLCFFFFLHNLHIFMFHFMELLIIQFIFPCYSESSFDFEIMLIVFFILKYYNWLFYKAVMLLFIVSSSYFKAYLLPFLSRVITVATICCV